MRTIQTRKKILEQKKNKQQARQLQPGDKVTLVDSDATGIVEKIEKGMATLQLGLLRMTLPLDELVLLESAVSPKTKTSTPHVKKLVGQVELFPEIDVRGLTANEALEQLEVYLDRALLDNLSRFRIIHGKGQGVLKQAIGKWLKKQPQIKDYFQPDNNQGVTEVVL